MAKLNSFIYEKLFFDNHPQLTQEYPNITQMKKIQQFEVLLNEFEKNIPDLNNLKEKLEFINYLLNSINVSEFDTISIKYLNKLDAIYKDQMNKVKTQISSNGDSSINFSIIEVLNVNFANFFKFFNKNFQNYNDKHKNIIKIIPNVLKIYFKLTEDVLVANNILIHNVQLLKTFTINTMTLINYFPTIVRPYESRLDNIFRSIFSQLISCNLINNKQIVKLICLTYSLLIRLSPDVGTKVNQFVNKFLVNLNFFKSAFEPKTIKTAKMNKLNLDDKDTVGKLIFITNSENEENKSFLQKLVKNPNFHICKNIFHIILRLIKCTFQSIPKNATIETNFSSLLTNIFEHINNSSDQLIFLNSSDYIIEGLQLEDYKLFFQFTKIEIFKILKFLIKNYSEYFYNYINSFKSSASKIALNFEKEYTNYFESYLGVLSYIKSLIKSFDSRMHSTIEEFIFKILGNNFIDIYISYLERNDRTVVKIDQNYFKLNQVKTGNAGNKKKVSLIQMAKQETYNEKLEKYSNSEIELIIHAYFEVFIAYFQSDCFSHLLTNNDNKALLRSLVELVVLPPYSKYIFSISNSLKNNLVNFVYYFTKNSHTSLIDLSIVEKFNSFLQGFYTNESESDNRVLKIYEMLTFNKVNPVYTNTNSYNSEITNTVIEMNKKIAERLRKNVNLVLQDFYEKEVTSQENILLKTKQNKIQTKETEDKKTSFKIELSLRDEDNEIKDKKMPASKNNQEVEAQPVKKRCTEENNVNKLFFKSKWKQVQNKGSKSKKTSEFVSNDGIYVSVKNKESFINEPKVPVPEKEDLTPITSKKKEESDSDEEDDMDLEIPDLI